MHFLQYLYTYAAKVFKNNTIAPMIIKIWLSCKEPTTRVAGVEEKSK